MTLPNIFWKNTMYYILPIFTIFIVIGALINEYTKRGFTLVFMSQIWFLVIYCLAPIAIISSYDEVASKAFNLNKNDVESFYVQLLILLFYFSFIFGTNLGNHYKGFLKISVSNKNIRRLCYTLVLIGLFSMGVFLSKYGGISYVLSNMSQIRSGQADVKSYLGAFFLGFYKFVNLSFFICFAKILIDDSKQNISFKFYFLANLMFSIFGIYLSAGRENGISFLISIIVIYMAVKKKIPLKFSIFFILFTVFYIVFGKTLIFALYDENFDISDFFNNRFYYMILDSFNIIMVEFAHQYMSIVNFISVDGTFNYFSDYYIWILTPFKLIGINFGDSISYYNTYIIMGRWESIIPPGPVAFGYMSLGVLGVFIHGIIVGYIFRAVDSIFNINNQVKIDPVMVGFYGMLVPTFTYIMSNSDLTLFFQNRLAPLVFFLALVFIYKARYLIKRY